MIFKISKVVPVPVWLLALAMLGSSRASIPCPGFLVVGTFSPDYSFLLFFSFFYEDTLPDKMVCEDGSYGFQNI